MECLKQSQTSVTKDQYSRDRHEQDILPERTDSMRQDDLVSQEERGAKARHARSQMSEVKTNTDKNCQFWESGISSIWGTVSCITT